ncbi:hypothetical protein BN2364_3254 [Alloalcanivorax xenomutans]|nr:hypothetical protein BN2364_3254 [Alloalcanivorax xenomutans]
MRLIRHVASCYSAGAPVRARAPGGDAMPSTVALAPCSGGRETGS